MQFGNIATRISPEHCTIPAPMKSGSTDATNEINIRLQDVLNLNERNNNAYCRFHD